MQRLDVSTRERISTQIGVMDLDAGRLNLAEAVKLFSVVVGAWGVGMVGALLAGLSSGWSDYDPRPAIIFRAALMVFGGGLAALCWWLAGSVCRHMVAEWRAYRWRRDEWHAAQLAAYEQAGGQAVDRTLTIKALSVAEPLHVLGVALALAQKVREGQAKEPSVAALTGPVWVGRFQAGELTKADAEKFGAALHQLGLIKGRKAGHAGQLVTLDEGEIVRLVSENAGKIRAVEGERPELPAGGR